MTERSFAVIIPIFRAEKYLKSCFDSVIKQIYPHFTVIAVDDGSPDRCPQICDDYAKADSRFHIIHQSNSGSFAARAAGIRYAMQHLPSETYLVFLDADDMLKENALDVLQDAISQTGAEMIFYRFNMLRNGKCIAASADNPSYQGIIEDKATLYRTVFLAEKYNAMWRKSVSLRLFSEDILTEKYQLKRSEDLLQSIPLYHRCNRAVFLPDVLYEYNLVDSSITNRVTFENYTNTSPAQQAVWDFVHAEGLWNEKDYADYLSHCAYCLRETVWTIARMPSSIRNRKKLYDEILSDPFYMIVFRHAAESDLLLKMIQHRHCFVLCCTGSAAFVLGRIRRLCRRLLSQ